MSRPRNEASPGPAVAQPVLQAVAQSVVDATGAAAGWIVSSDGDELVVVAAAGEETSGLIGQAVGANQGTVGFVVGSGQPLALTGSAPDPRLSEGVAALWSRQPAAVLCVPCSSGDAVVGALEAVDKLGGGGFTFDDLELATLLANIGAAALAESSPAAATPSPAELAGELERLASADAVRYRSVATALDALLAHG